MTKFRVAERVTRAEFALRDGVEEVQRTVTVYRAYLDAQTEHERQIAEQITLMTKRELAGDIIPGDSALADAGELMRFTRWQILARLEELCRMLTETLPLIFPEPGRAAGKAR